MEKKQETIVAGPWGMKGSGEQWEVSSEEGRGRSCRAQEATERT